MNEVSSLDLNGKYFMSQEEEKAAEVKRAMEYAEAKKRLRNLEGEAEAIGQKWHQLALMLMHNSDCVIFKGQAFDHEEKEYQNRPRFDPQMLTEAARIPALVNEIRETKAHLGRLRKIVGEAADYL